MTGPLSPSFTVNKYEGEPITWYSKRTRDIKEISLTTGGGGRHVSGGITKFHHPFIGGITKFQVSKMGGGVTKIKKKVAAMLLQSSTIQ